MKDSQKSTKDATASDVEAIVMRMGKRDKKRFAKLMAIISVYQADPEWDLDIKDEVDLFAVRLADRYNFPDGWHKLGSYDEAVRFYQEKCA